MCQQELDKSRLRVQNAVEAWFGAALRTETELIDWMMVERIVIYIYNEYIVTI